MFCVYLNWPGDQIVQDQDHVFVEAGDQEGHVPHWNVTN